MRRRTIRVQNVRAIPKRVFLPHDPAPRVRPVFRSRFQQIPSHVRLSEIVLQVRRRWRREIDFSHVLDQSIDEQLLSSSSSFVLPSSSSCCCFPHEEGDDDILFLDHHQNHHLKKEVPSSSSSSSSSSSFGLFRRSSCSNKKRRRRRPKSFSSRALCVKDDRYKRTTTHAVGQSLFLLSLVFFSLSLSLSRIFFSFCLEKNDKKRVCRLIRVQLTQKKYALGLY